MIYTVGGLLSHKDRCSGRSCLLFGIFYLAMVLAARNVSQKKKKFGKL